MTSDAYRYPLLAGAAVLAVSIGTAAKQPVAFSYAGAETQTAQGQMAYAEHCAACHGYDLQGGEAPTLAGDSFLNSWRGRTAHELRELIVATMPPGSRGLLNDSVYTNVLAYILQVNGHSVAAEQVLADSAVVIGSTTAMEVEAPVDGQAVAGGGATPQQQPAQGGSSAAINQERLSIDREVKNFTPVTEEMLQNPAPGDWLTWRRTLDGQGYSPLNEVNRDNVDELQLSWAWAMADGSNETTPLVHDGVMYLVNPDNIVQALDATNGGLIWEYKWDFQPEAKQLGGNNRNIAIYQDKLFLATYDAVLVALDARSGKLVWQTQKADYKQGYTHTSGPIIANGVIVSGIKSCRGTSRDPDNTSGCFVTGHSAESGEELWRTSTIARPDDINTLTWGGVPFESRQGGDTWIPGSYDPELNLYYVGTAQAKPWVPASRGMTVADEALYTSSTLALDPKTGEIVWHFQHVPGEALDLDVVFERVLVDLDGQKLLFTIGKDGILWKLDRRSGAFVGAAETLFQNVFDSIDETGKVHYRSDIAEAGVGDTIFACPSYIGGHNWQATAYSPETNALIIPLSQTCMTMEGRDAGSRVDLLEMPDTDGNLGRLAGFDLRSMKELWKHEQRAPFMTGVLTSGGGLAFAGDMDRYFKAFDVRTGEVLWQVRLGTSAQGFPITYSVGGKQYIAVPTGNFSWMQSVAAELMEERLTSVSNNGNALYVFALPDRQ